MNKKQKKTLVEIILSSILIFINILLSSIFKTELMSFLSLILYLITYFIIGRKVLFKAIKNILKGHVFDEIFLMALATIGAFILKEYFEGVAVMLFYQIGELFQDIAVSSSRKSITHLIELVPTSTLRINGDDIEEIDVEEVNVGDILLIKVGEKIPVDALIIDGSTTIDTSSLTGESLPVEKSINEEVLSGTINLSNVIKVKALKTAENSTIFNILNLIEDATISKGKTESFISKFAKFYTPIVVILAFIISVVPPLFDGFIFAKWILKGLSFLVISCPCALVISVPLSFFSGIGKASRNGILIKGSNYVEKLSKVDYVFLDKTGTITNGNFEVESINNISNFTIFNNLLYSIERYSTHPLAKAICSYLNEYNVLEINDVKEIPGKGIIGYYEDKLVVCGNKSLLNDYNIKFKSEDGTLIYLAYDNKYLGYALLNDLIKEDSKIAIERIKSTHVKDVIMLTGDKSDVSKYVANLVNITTYKAELLPQEKLDVITQYKEKGYITCFVGDGINDAPSLALADVSLSMGSGSTLALETSDIVIINNSLISVYNAIKIAKSTMKIAYFNIVFSIFIKILFLLLSVFGLSNMLFAIFADVGVMIICVLNSMRNLIKKRIK